MTCLDDLEHRDSIVSVKIPPRLARGRQPFASVVTIFSSGGKWSSLNSLRSVKKGNGSGGIICE